MLTFRIFYRNSLIKPSKDWFCYETDSGFAIEVLGLAQAQTIAKDLADNLNFSQDWKDYYICDSTGKHYPI